MKKFLTSMTYPETKAPADAWRRRDHADMVGTSQLAEPRRPTQPRRTRRRVARALAVAALIAGQAACQERDGDRTTAGIKAPTLGTMRPIALPDTPSPTSADPTAYDASVEAALRELRIHTRCNDVSGCPAADTLRAAGVQVSDALVHLARAAKPRAQWLPRVTLLLGELGDAQGVAALEQLLQREEDGVRAAAIFALVSRGRLDDARLEQDAATLSAAAVSRSRVTALWALARDGDPAAVQRFQDEIQALGGQLVAADTLRWAVWLCGQRAIPRCDSLYAGLARHPALLVRREVLRRIREAPTRGDLDALLMLVGDPSSNLARDASQTLHEVTGLRGTDAASWQMLLAQEPKPDVGP